MRECPRLVRESAITRARQMGDGERGERDYTL